jgi:hypothetical protein
MMKRVIFLLAMVLMFSCEKDLMENDALGENAGIVGTWIEDGYSDEVALFERADSLDYSKYGFIINEDGTFTERKNAGWCGTPPITYSNFQGEWLALSDSLIEITVGYWGGTLSYQMRIVFVDQESLGIRYLYAENRADAR